MADRQFLEQLTKRLADDGKIIEAGWVAMRLAVVPQDAPPVQLEAMRLAYMAGAQHVFSSMMGMMDDDAEPTEDDMRRMDLIHAELQAFTREMELRYRKPQGRG